MGATVRGSNTGGTSSAGDPPEEADSSGSPRPPWGLILAALIIAGSTGIASAQTTSVTPPLEEATRVVDETVDKAKATIEDQTTDVTKKVEEQASRVLDKSKRVTGDTTDTLGRGVTKDGTRAEARAAPRNKAREKATRDKKKRGDTTAQAGGSRGDKNEGGDINTLVDAGNEIEGAQAESKQPAPEPTDRRKSLPLTGFDPRTWAVVGFGLIGAGVLVLAMRPRPHTVTGA
jgi:hypothetical protein